MDLPEVFKQTERCASRIARYLNTEDDMTFHGDFALIMNYFSILKKTIKNLTKHFHNCNKDEIHWSTERDSSGEVLFLRPVCGCEKTRNPTIKIDNRKDEVIGIELDCDSEEYDIPTSISPQIKMEDEDAPQSVESVELPTERLESPVNITGPNNTKPSIKRLRKRRNSSLGKQPDKAIKRLSGPHRRGVKLKQWKEEDMTKALQVISEENMSVNMAATKFCLPRKTLAFRLKLLQNKDNETEKFKCSHCDKEYSSQRSRYLHEWQHHGTDQPFLCTICGKAFIHEAVYDKHMNTHLEQRKYTCEKCGEAFHMQKELYSHYRHHTNLPYICLVCGEGFQTKQEQITHSLHEHKSNWKHQCPHCDMRYEFPMKLTEHIRSAHTGEKPVSCSMCDKKFASVATKNLHIKECHKRVEQFVTCSYCGKLISCKCIDRHVAVVHKGEKDYKCQHCDHRFGTMENLKRHIRTHTGEKPYLCIHCDKTFNQGNSLKQHHDSHHPDKVYQVNRTDKNNTKSSNTGQSKTDVNTVYQEDANTQNVAGDGITKSSSLSDTVT